jgi:phosphoglycolate phosphatase
MIDLLKRLKSEGHKLYVATSKPEKISVEILHKFEMAQYFDLIVGSVADGIRDAKADVIAYVLKHMAPADEAVMVGDTVYDILGANAHNLRSIAVSWGFGDLPDMIAAGAGTVVNTMDELYQAIKA